MDRIYHYSRHRGDDVMQRDRVLFYVDCPTEDDTFRVSIMFVRMLRDIYPQLVEKGANDYIQNFYRTDVRQRRFGHDPIGEISYGYLVIRSYPTMDEMIDIIESLKEFLCAT